MKKHFIYPLVFALAGCASTQLDELQILRDELPNSQGKHIDAFLEAYGNPDSSNDLTSWELGATEKAKHIGYAYVWKQDSVKDSRLNDNSALIAHNRCRLTLKTDLKRIITNYSFTGSSEACEVLAERIISDRKPPSKATQAGAH